MKLQRLDTRTRQKQIVEAALEIIHQHGLAKLTIKELAQKVCISEQAIYRHFENKLAILQALLQYFSQSLHTELQNIQLKGNYLNGIRELIIRHLIFFAKHPSMAALVYPEEVFQTEPMIGSKVQETINTRISFIAEIIAEAQNEGIIVRHIAPGNLALIIFGSIRILVTQWRFSGRSFDLVSKGKIMADDLIALIDMKSNIHST